MSRAFNFASHKGAVLCESFFQADGQLSAEAFSPRNGSKLEQAHLARFCYVLGNQNVVFRKAVPLL